MSPAQAPSPFVVGVGRSGTTLLRLMLDTHPELAIPPESHFIPELIAAAAAAPLDPERAVDVIASVRQWGDFGFERGELVERMRAGGPLDAAAATRVFFRAYADRHGKPRWGDKTPIYVEHMAEIGDLLGEARFIHLIRDGRDVALSRSTWSEGQAPDPSKAARRWRRRIERARNDSEALPYIELRYEDLVLETEPTLRKVCEFVELDYDPVMLRYHERAEERLREIARDLPAKGRKGVRSGADRLAIHTLTKEPPKAERVARWRTEMTAADRAEYEAEAGDLLAELGYETGSSLSS